MSTITSYFGFLLAVLTITAGIFISLNKIRLIWFAELAILESFLYSIVYYPISNSWWLRFIVNRNSYLRSDITPTFFTFNQTKMIEVFLFGIVLGLIPITLAGLFVTAYLQYRRGDQLDIWFSGVSFVYWPPLFFYFNPNSQEIKLKLLIRLRLLSHSFSLILNLRRMNGITLCRIWTYDIGFWRPAFYRTELRALSFPKEFDVMAIHLACIQTQYGELFILSLYVQFESLLIDLLFADMITHS